YLTVQATTRFVVAIYQTPLAQSRASEVGQFAYLVALLSWTWTITHRDPIPAPPSAEALARMQQLSSDDEVVSKERILAAVGIKIARPGADVESADKQEQDHPKLPV